MSNEVDITKQRSTLNWYQIGTLIAAAFGIAWTLAGIYFRFQHVEENRKIDQSRIEYVNDRIDKKFDQLKERISKLEKQE